MNPGAVQLYRDHGIDLAVEPLEIAVCAQHNNGGLAAGAWWEAENLPHLFPVGEVNGSHGVYRPGGSALNSGQVGSLRAAEFIAARRAGRTLDRAAAEAAAAARWSELDGWLERGRAASTGWREARAALQARLSRAGAHVRSRSGVAQACDEAAAQCRELEGAGCRWARARERAEALRTRSLALAHRAYLEAIRFALDSGVGSRGSALALADAGAGGSAIHGRLPDVWKFVPEDAAFREQVLESEVRPDGTIAHAWRPRRPLPRTDGWFETTWAAFREGRVYDA